jgi:hypothetical protein
VPGLRPGLGLGLRPGLGPGLGLRPGLGLGLGLRSGLRLGLRNSGVYREENIGIGGVARRIKTPKYFRCPNDS